MTFNLAHVADLFRKGFLPWALLGVLYILSMGYGGGYVSYELPFAVVSIVACVLGDYAANLYERMLVEEEVFGSSSN